MLVNTFGSIAPKQYAVLILLKQQQQQKCCSIFSNLCGVGQSITWTIQTGNSDVIVIVLFVQGKYDVKLLTKIEFVKTTAAKLLFKTL